MKFLVCSIEIQKHGISRNYNIINEVPIFILDGSDSVSNVIQAVHRFGQFTNWIVMHELCETYLQYAWEILITI